MTSSIKRAWFTLTVTLIVLPWTKIAPSEPAENAGAAHALRLSISRTKAKSHVMDAAFLECSLAETLIGAAKGLAVVEDFSDLGDLS